MNTSPRALHWVLKIGNLKNSLNFFENVLGLRVLRHEEFDTGCEATCNGPYGGAWSKTMIGYGPELTNFALELTYNYGIDAYQKGNDLEYIALSNPAILQRAEKFGIEIVDNTITGPDNYKYKIIPAIAGRAEQFNVVAFRVVNLENALKYWVNTLGLKVFETPEGLKTTEPSCIVGFGEDQTHLQLIQTPSGVAVDHALSSGRIAFACHKVAPIFEMITASGDVVQVPPLTLPTPGKADVVVTILNDRDAYEICFVEDEAFYDLATPKYDVVDFAARAAKGGDGVPLPTFEAIETHGDVGVLSTVDDVTDVLETANKDTVVVLDFTAGWCKNCKRISPLITQLATLHAANVRVFTVDVVGAQEVALEYDVSTLPHIKFFKNNELIDDYVGSSEEEITAKFAAASH